MELPDHVTSVSLMVVYITPKPFLRWWDCFTLLPAIHKNCGCTTSLSTLDIIKDFLHETEVRLLLWQKYHWCGILSVSRESYQNTHHTEVITVRLAAFSWLRWCELGKSTMKLPLPLLLVYVCVGRVLRPHTVCFSSTPWMILPCRSHWPSVAQWSFSMLLPTCMG